MKTTIRTIKAVILGILFIVMFGSPMGNTFQRFGENESFYRRDYSKIYLEHCRKRYQIIYNDENRSLDEIVARK